ncbi:hypothetical protein ON010_g3246 [Phytophthora cinnamomi]|nr:hypothetical protein ON010_g3246 [Phytophthora cinnamomi]
MTPSSSDGVPQPDRYQPLPPLTLHATARFRFGPEGLMLPSTGPAAREDPRPLPSQTATNLGFYRCPLYKCPAQLALLENALGYVFLPIPVDQNPGTMSVHGAALFLLEPQF